MPEMSRPGKFFVNRINPFFYRRTFEDLQGLLSISRNANVLEVGAGGGALALLVYERFHPSRITVTDYDEEQVALARRNVGRAHGAIPQGFVVEGADALRLSYPNRTFDLVLAFEVFHHLGNVEDMRKGLDEIARVLMPSGRLVYEELFHKRRIRDYLVALGFDIPSGMRRRRLLGLAELVVARNRD